jgi:DNA-binding MarR family transcriptional regulator
MKAEHVRAIQRWYPQIYFACHTRHERATSSDARVSGHDSGVLSHLDETRPITAAALARHLGVGPSTLSATLNRLTKLGYITRTAAAADRRVLELRLTKAGARVMQAGSVLDSSRVAAVLDELSAAEQRVAVEGLGLLARASREATLRWARSAGTTRSQGVRRQETVRRQRR